MESDEVTQQTPPYWRIIDRPRLKVQIQWEPRDLWIGLFWRRTKIAMHFYLCLLPMLPLHVSVARRPIG